MIRRMGPIILKFQVSKSAQTSGGGDFIVKFDAIVELLPAGTTSVEIGSLHERSEPSHKEAAMNAILTGFQSVLRPRNLGGNCRIENLVLHPVDFKPLKFAECSAEALAAQLAAIPIAEPAAFRPKT